MKITVDQEPPATLEAFADEHGLEMRVRILAHLPPGNTGRYCASFDWVEILVKGCMLSSPCGYGETPKKAMENYAREISGKWLVYKAYDKAARLELKAPYLEK